MEEKDIYIYKTIRRIKIKQATVIGLKRFDNLYKEKQIDWDQKGAPFFVRIDFDNFIIISHYGLKSKFTTHYDELKYLVDIIKNNCSYAKIEIFCCYPKIAKRREKEFSKYIKGKTKNVCAFRLIKHKKERILELCKSATIINRKKE
jgi:hypothetical protein